MSIALFLKKNLTNIPPGVGKLINKIPYEWRPGLSSIYKRRKAQMMDYENFSVHQRQSFIFSKVADIALYSYHNVEFYKRFYDSKGFNLDRLKSFDDIKRIPIITKAILNEYDIEQRSSKILDRYIVNTGGSSGTPFSFYIEPSSMGHEWAHMHDIWGKFGYRPSDFKLVFAGRSDLKCPIEYDAVRNHFAIDIYAEYKLVANALIETLKKYTIKYLHGYPSSIYDFAIYCQNEHPVLQKLLMQNLKGIFLGSEYPHAHYRDLIESIFNTKTISWYGHTERAVLAYEKNEKFIYEPYNTYGFSEAINANDNESELVGTSYYNFASPLVRYNTNDIISDVSVSEGILNSFKITKGREGDFILDRNGKKINLTGLIFGRHHEIFNYSKFIQVKQIEIGRIEIHFVSDILTQEHAAKLFDSQNLNLEITFVKQEQPFRTRSGKINLLIK
jgi:phenylacetate-CoA ligase